MAPATLRSRSAASRASGRTQNGGSGRPRRHQDTDVASEDEAAPPATRRQSQSKKQQMPAPEKKRSALKKSKGIDGGEDGSDMAEQDDSEPEEDFDKEMYLNQPLNKKEGERIQGYSSDWESLRKNFRTEAVDIVKLLAGDMAEYAQGKEDAKEPQQLDRIMREILDIDQAFQLHKEALDELHQSVRIGDEIRNIVKQYDSIVEKKKEAYNAKTTRQKYAKAEDYVQFKQNIFEVNHPGDAIPPITEFIPREDGDESDDEDDVQVGGITQDYKCPISLTTLQNPMTSQVCHHSFSGATIREFLKNGAKQCPAAGCNKKLTLSDLKEDKQLARRVKDAVRREQMRAEEENDAVEEIID